jgi:hypothetical protein
MNVPAPRALIDFAGAVACTPGVGAVSLVLAGREGDAEVKAHLASVDAGSLAGWPPVLHEVRLYELSDSDPGGARRYELHARELQRELRARSLQLHREAGREFFRAVPPVHVPLVRRAGWSLLLWLLRMPGFVGLLRRLRGST